MKTHEHITPEQQIANQKAEIESLNRKIENLEAQLQKYMDPDSGEINPSVKYHFKSGEAALLEQVAELQSQLDECLDPEYTFRPSNRFNAAAERIIEVLFEPITVFIPVESKGIGRREEKDRRYVWGNFKTDLFTAKHIESFWGRPEFRIGIELITDVCGILDKAFFALSEGDYTEIPMHFLLFDPEAKIKAVECLIEALHTFQEIAERRMTDDDISDIMLTLKTISLIQRSGGYLIHDDDDE